MQDVIVIGGGVIGLTSAYELAGRGLSVSLLEAQQPGSEASWAGAGILPPGHPGDPQHPLAALCRATVRMWPGLTSELLEATGIDNGFRRCGGIGAYADVTQEAELDVEIDAWRKADVHIEPLDAPGLARWEPALVQSSRGYRLPDQCQVRNPRHLKALEVGCTRRGVHICCGQPVVSFELARGQIRAAVTPTELFEAGTFLITAGAWTQQLLAAVGCRATVVPVRGQMVLLRLPRPIIDHVIESGPRYLVPRPDGRLLIGSTEEWVGFQKANTADALRNLLDFAVELVPALANATVERTWSGLRPHVPDGLPYLGRLPDLSNAYVAAGHFRGGLNLSPITGRVMSQLITGQEPEISMAELAPDRTPSSR
ncbi:MAG: glycine oxidase ThiO [Planctomycetaceae bacterium]|nr:glycine oxidase ThiO [Planctomycetaceae bacterium]